MTRSRSRTIEVQWLRHHCASSFPLIFARALAFKRTLLLSRSAVRPTLHCSILRALSAALPHACLVLSTALCSKRGTGAAGCVIAFSTTDRDSFDAVKNWIRKVEDEVQNVPMVLVQNKIDLVDQAFFGSGLTMNRIFSTPPQPPHPLVDALGLFYYYFLGRFSFFLFLRIGFRCVVSIPCANWCVPSDVVCNWGGPQAVMTPEEANAKAEAIKLAFYRTSVMENFKVSASPIFLTWALVSPPPRFIAFSASHPHNFRMHWGGGGLRGRYAHTYRTPPHPTPPHRTAPHRTHRTAPHVQVTEVFEYLAQKYLEKRRAETAAAKKAAPKNSNFEDGPSKGGASEAAK